MRHKGVIFDCKDHPDGLATMIVADNCTYGCKNCINKHLKGAASQSADYIGTFIEQVLDRSLTNLLVLGGLEWTEQIFDLYRVLYVCEMCGANVILYTHYTEDELKEKFPKLLEYPIYIKYGAYIEELKSSTHFSYGIPLASTNQYIKKNVVAKP